LNSQIQKINELGQSVWLDSISRGMINSGKLSSMISEGISGITSNPAIFQKALSSENTYDKDIKSLTNLDPNAKSIFQDLSIKDISDACKLLRTVYKKTEGKDGFVSIEIDPKFANDTKKSIREGIYLHESINQPNVMIKVPGTEAGMPVIEHLIGLGINVNVTLLFSRSMYKKAAKAYINGLYKLSPDQMNKVNSVASFFISRIDTSADIVINEKSQGKVAISNAILAYQDYKKIFSEESFGQLENNGANKQRLLWASTSVKNPNYEKLLYVNKLIGPETVNTVPENVYEEIISNNIQYKDLLNSDTKYHEEIIINALSNDELKNITDELLSDGIRLFEEAFDSLLNEINNKITDHS
tara:strand:- start:8170 stop:9243 length:1074 start_codon:yes stop_codon:yes gene_type:complete